MNNLIIMLMYTATGPILLDYKQLVNAKEGEQVILSVTFSGTPKPTITWTFKGNKLEGDYTTELDSDGSLMFFCVESKHAGK